MKRLEAIEKIKKSLSEGSNTPCTWRSDRENYISEMSEELLSRVIDPVRVKITSASFPEYAYTEYQDLSVWAVARSEKNWLLTPDSKQEFALGFGENSQNIEMHGFSSSDALAEWLG